MNKQYNIGIDIGGTKVNIGMVTLEGEIVDHLVIPSMQKEVLNIFIERIVLKLRELMEKNEISYRDINFIGIGVPGTVNMKEGMVAYCPNLGWEGIPLKQLFSEYVPDVEIGIIQDSWAAAIAEHEYGAGIGCANVACVTLGTGIGCGVIINHKIFAGGMHCAGEIGHVIVQKDGLPCNCGRKGCLERYASGTGIFEQAYSLFPEKFKGREKKTETVFQLAYENYQPALDLIKDSMEMLALGLANLVSILSIEKILISGGLCSHTNLVVKPLQENIYRYGYPAWVKQKKFRVECAKVKENAPMLGAAVMYKALS